MNIAYVAGATGYTGREVVRLLCAAGVQTIAHVRPNSSRLAEWTERFTAMGAQVDATPWEADAMATRLNEISPTCVFGLLGTTRKRGKAARKDGLTETYETIDYGLTALLIQACTTLPTKPRFVYLSSLGVSKNAASAYAKARWKTETYLRESGLCYTIARPGFIPGPDRDDSRPGEVLGAKTLDGLLSIIAVFGGKGTQQRYRSISNTHLARALLRGALEVQEEQVVLESQDLQRLGSL